MALKKSSSKRELEDVPEAYLVDLLNGSKHGIGNKEDFTIGRYLTCSLTIEEKYISRIQCVIKYDNHCFILNDHGTSSGILFINYTKMQTKDFPYTLKHGDIIAFHDGKKYSYLYEFIFTESPEQKFKRERNETIMQLTRKNEELESDMASLDLSVTKLNIDFHKFKEDVQSKIAAFQKKILSLSSFIENQSRDLELKKYCVDSMKSRVLNQLEDNFQCAICNEIVVKATIGDCNHTFCENCITTWLKKSKLCPVCRTTMKSTYNTLAVDNFITDVCELLGGPIHEQRTTLLKERNCPVLARTRPKLLNHRRPAESTQQERPHRSGLRFGQRPQEIETVDLTHLG